jgi:hypothetical protein
MKTILSILTAIALGACSQYNPALVRPYAYTGASAALYAAYTQSPAKAQEVAKDFVSGKQAFDSLGGGAVPNAAQVALALNTYLPANPSRPVVAATASTAWAIFYPQIKDKGSPVVQDALTNVLLGFQDAATPYLPNP